MCDNELLLKFFAYYDNYQMDILVFFILIHDHIIRLATTNSSVLLRVCGHHTIVKDTIIGEASVSLQQMLQQHQGKLNNVVLSLPLTCPPNKAVPTTSTLKYSAFYLHYLNIRFPLLFMIL